MLVLTIKEGERIEVGPDVVVRVKKTRDGNVRLIFDAPKHVRIMRGTVVDRKKNQLDENETCHETTPN